MLYIRDSCLEVEPLLSLDNCQAVGIRKYVKFINGMRSVGRCWYCPNSEKGPTCIIITKGSQIDSGSILSVNYNRNCE